MCTDKIICIHKGSCNRKKKNLPDRGQNDAQVFFLLVDAFVMEFLNCKGSEMGR